jgi:AcrR family transcriptional regulator
MAEQTGDRRTRRTRKLLKQGLLELLHEKRFSEISAREITDRADLNRGTFYLHFSDTAALMRSIEEDMLREVQALVDDSLAQAAESRSLRMIFEALLDYTVEHRDVCAALFENTSGSALLDRLQGLVQRNGMVLLRRQYAIRDDTAAAYLLAFLAYGLVGLVREWFDCGMAIPREELVRMADALAASAVQTLIAA